jgi:hypothetical protein
LDKEKQQLSALLNKAKKEHEEKLKVEMKAESAKEVCNNV